MDDTVPTQCLHGSGLVFPGLLGGRGESFSPVLGTGGSYLPLYIVADATLECRSGVHPANTIRSPGADLVLGQRRIHWPGIVLALGRCLLFAG